MIVLATGNQKKQKNMCAVSVCVGNVECVGNRDGQEYSNIQSAIYFRKIKTLFKFSLLI